MIGELKDRLHRGTRGGQHGFLFDYAQDTLNFSRFQAFNFAGWGDAHDVLALCCSMFCIAPVMKSPIRRNLQPSSSFFTR
jgi:type IV secretory pathway VirB4 component